MYSTDTELTNLQAQGASPAGLLPEAEAVLSTHESLSPVTDLVAASEAACPRERAVESLARHMNEEAERYIQRMRSLDAFLHSGKVRRRTAWQRSRKTR
jgi:hypothetical protein